MLVRLVVKIKYNGNLDHIPLGSRPPRSEKILTAHELSERLLVTERESQKRHPKRARVV